ncbi:MAG: AAA family ATPase [Desulfobacteraceae bacterium]|nr:AAA family ATPase [Desulfobacteraceae bacterium]
MGDTQNELSKDLLSAVLNNPYEHIIIIDRYGKVRFMSQAYEKYYPVSAASSRGKYISDVIPESKLSRVLETGKAEIGDFITVKGENRITAKIPLKKNGRVIGAVGKLMFSNPTQVKNLYKRIESLEKNLNHYKDELSLLYDIRYSFSEIIGNSPSLKDAKALSQLAAENDSPVLITGESGTGKELFAHAIHRAGKRRQQNFVRVNCAAIPKELFEAEMFGYEPGAFTGANPKGKPGKFELADKGTIFLDEIGDMPLKMQVKLMRVLQEKEVERIGENKPRQIDFRIISATNQDLEELINKRKFRLDLYYRFNVINIHLPALRDIPEDIPLIFKHLIEKLLSNHKHPAPTVAPEVLTALQRYDWPGNARELKNVAERAIILHQNNCIKLKDLPIPIQDAIPTSKACLPPLTSLKTIMEDTERKTIIRALKQTNDNKIKASELLGIHRTGLYQKMKKYNII